MLMYEGMVTAFHLLNLPSNFAVLGGVCLLLLTAAVGFGRVLQDLEEAVRGMFEDFNGPTIDGRNRQRVNLDLQGAAFAG